jgi:hypothetical protein
MATHLIRCNAPSVTAGGSALSYDSGSGHYNYAWKTDKAWAGTCDN